MEGASKPDPLVPAPRILPGQFPLDNLESESMGDESHLTGRAHIALRWSRLTKRIVQGAFTITPARYDVGHLVPWRSLVTEEDSESQRDRIRGWTIIALCLAVVLTCAEGTVFSRDKGITFWSYATLEGVSIAVIPNFIAALLTFFIGYFVVLEDRHKRYVKAMRTIRNTVRDLRESVGIDPTKAQALMKIIVPAISELYFRKDRPPVPHGDEDKTYDRSICLSCAEACPVVGGRCDTCKDILESWKDDERKPKVVSAPGPS